MMRPENWPERLAAFIEARRTAPFAWGSMDCCTLAADWVQALGGADPIATWRGQYSTEAEADVLIGQAGGLANLATAAAMLAGFPEHENPAHAHRGDVALVRHGNQLAMGVISGNFVIVPGPDGLNFLPRSAVLRAWKI